MTISELIEKLKIAKEELGDIAVVTWPYDGQEIRHNRVAEIVLETGQYNYNCTQLEHLKDKPPTLYIELN